MWTIILWISYVLLGLGVLGAVHKVGYDAGHRVGWHEGFDTCKEATHELLIALVSELSKEKKP